MTQTVTDHPRPILEVANLNHDFGTFRALKDINFTVAKGEFITLLGPSGSGKSTLLRLLAGLELPTEAKALKLDGEDVFNVPANRRNVSTVFQHYGLFPHLNVVENVEYGLRVRKVPAAERREMALKMLDQVQLRDFANRPISRLSGGQRQRVALARSLVLSPMILLLDEPLGALDERLRIDMQVEILELQKRLEMTFIYVTHSQEEALTMSDRVLLMNKGEVVQSGTPEDLFDRPNSRFSASFMGMENIIEAEVTAISGREVTVSAMGHSLTGLWTAKTAPALGQQVCAAFRSERLSTDRAEARPCNSIEGTLASRVYKGKYLDMTYQTALGPIRMRRWDSRQDTAHVSRIFWPQDQTVLFPADS